LITRIYNSFACKCSSESYSTVDGPKLPEPIRTYNYWKYHP